MLDVQPDPVTAFRLSTDRKTTPFARPRKGKGAMVPSR